MASKRKLKKQITKLYKDVASEIVSGIDMFEYDLKATADLINETFDQMDDFLKRAAAGDISKEKATIKNNYNELKSDVKKHIEDTLEKVKNLPRKK